MHQDVTFTHVIVRYDTRDVHLAVVVCYATCLAEACVLLSTFMELAPCFAPTACYAIREMTVADLYRQK